MATIMFIYFKNIKKYCNTKIFNNIFITDLPFLVHYTNFNLTNSDFLVIRNRTYSHLKSLTIITDHRQS